MRFSFLVALVFIALPVQAALVERADGQAYYDTELNITWLADANYAQTSGYDADGLMNWADSMAWVDTLNTANHLGANTWRLPSVTDTGEPGCVDRVSYSNGDDCGFNVDTSTGEMASLFYDTLGNLARYDTMGNEQTDWGLVNTGPFSNIGNLYWSETVYALYPEYESWVFSFLYGGQLNHHQANTFGAWAVMDGDIGTTVVPLPAAVWLFGSAVAGLGWMRRKRTA